MEAEASVVVAASVEAVGRAVETMVAGVESAEAAKAVAVEVHLGNMSRRCTREVESDGRKACPACRHMCAPHRKVCYIQDSQMEGLVQEVLRTTLTTALSRL